MRKRKIRQAGGRCQQCGRSDLPLELHHVGDGDLADYSLTVVLCSLCHEQARPSKRRDQSAAARARRLSNPSAAADARKPSDGS